MEMVPEQELNGIKLSRQVATLRIFFFFFFYRSTQAQRSDTLPGRQEGEGGCFGWRERVGIE